MVLRVLSGIRPGCWRCVLLVLLGGWARENDTGLRLVSSKRDAFLIVNGQLLEGSVLLVPDRSGRVAFAADRGGVRSCAGPLRYSATYSAEIDLHCNDGTQLNLQTTLVSETRGYGFGTSAQGPASLAFGYSDQEAQAYLVAPAGTTLGMDASGNLALQAKAP